MIANEWLECSVKRATSITFSLFWIGFILIACKLDNNAASRPGLDDLSDTEELVLNIFPIFCL